MGEKEREIERVRKHLEALGKSAPTRDSNNPFVARLMKNEDELERMRAREHAIDDAKPERVAQLRAALEPFVPKS